MRKFVKCEVYIVETEQIFNVKKLYRNISRSGEKDQKMNISGWQTILVESPAQIAALIDYLCS